MDKCVEALSLALADRGGAAAVNIAGSNGVKWDGPSPADLTDDTFRPDFPDAVALIDMAWYDLTA